MSRPTTNDQALRTLGATSRAIRRTVTPYVEFEELESGSRLLSVGETYTGVLVGVAGSAAVRGPGLQLSLLGPFVLDSWVLDSSRRSMISGSASSRLAVLRIDWQYRFVVFECLPQLVELCERTHANVFAGGPPANAPWCGAA